MDSLRPLRPQKILVSIDGPKSQSADLEKVKLVEDEIYKINWTDDVEIRLKKSNLGIRFAVPEAVSWAISAYGKVIVLEDDVRPGDDFFDFMNFALKEYEAEERVGHVSGYSAVPYRHLTQPGSMLRVSRYPESYAWGTWERSWSKYSDSLDWALNLSSSELRETTGSWVKGKVWEINFNDAHVGAISSWAYRWLASLWKNDLMSLSPNRNLCRYTGHKNGTHTFLPKSYSELAVSGISELSIPAVLDLDITADNWISQKDFRASPFGLVRRYMESMVLNFMKSKHLK